tara:strand:- start:524 stop:1138 length:615 start_codon:yes stop_codon:yes gene_type:complete
MFTTYVKQLFLFIFIGLLVTSCDNDNDNNTIFDDIDHTDAEGLVLEDSAGNIKYREFMGSVTNELILEIGDVLDLSVHFLDADGEEIEHVHSDDEEDGLNIVITNEEIISVEVEEHSEDEAHGDDDHGDDHGDDDHGDDDHEELAIELSALSAGSTSFTISLMHGDHADYTTLEIAVIVSSPATMSCNSVCFKNCCSSQLYASK